MTVKRIAIVGAGLAGVKCAKTQRNNLSQDEYQIVVYNCENRMVFHPLRQILRSVHCRTADTQRVAHDAKVIEYEGTDGRIVRHEYGHLASAQRFLLA